VQRARPGALFSHSFRSGLYTETTLVKAYIQENLIISEQLFAYRNLDVTAQETRPEQTAKQFSTVKQALAAQTLTALLVKIVSTAFATQATRDQTPSSPVGQNKTQICLFILCPKGIVLLLAAVCMFVSLFQKT
jgi:hypothetical protein